nr:MAG TPA: Macoilin family [Caudoviricetes sp.]
MARKRNTGGNAQQRVAASTAKRIPSTRQEIVEDLRSVAAGGKPGGNRINEAYAAYRARKEQEQPERAMDEAVDAWVQWNQAQARTPQYRMAQDEAAEREASGYVSPEDYAASIRANKRAADRIRAGGVVMSDGRYHVGKRAQEELDRLAQSTARSELAMRAQEDETAMFRGSDYWLRRANELEQKRKASRSGYGGMMQGGTAFQETPEFTAQDRQDWDKAREYYYQVKNAERWGSMPEDLRQKALEAAGYVTDSVLAWQDGDEAALAGMTPDQRAQRQRDQRARRNQIAAILAGAGYEPEEVIEYASRVRNAERMQQEMAGLSEDVTGRGTEGVARGVYGTVQSYATNLLSPIGSVGLLAQKLFRGGAGAEQYRPVDYNTPSMYFSQGTSTIRGAVGGQMGEVGRFFYDTVNSAVDSGVRMLVGQALGGGGIKPSPDMSEEAAAKLNRFVSGFISTQMSGEVFANSFVQAKESGSTDADALLDSVTSALIEGLTEKYSVESILRNPNGLTWTALRNSFLAEGSEEMASDFLNTVYDELKNGDDSELRAQYRELLASGATEDDAFSRVFGDYVKQVVLDGLAGGLSGIAMSGVAEYATNKRYEKAYADPADTQALLDEARAVNPDSKLLKRAEQRVAEGKGVTGYQARELMGRNEEKLAPLKQASAKYGKQSGAMQATYQEGQDVAQYDMSYRVAYEMGKAGTKLSAAQTSTATDYLTDAQKQAAWSAGRDARTRLSDVSEVANGRALLNGQIVQVQTISAQDGKLMAEVRQGESVQTVALDSLKVDAGTRTLAEGAKQYGSAAGTVFEQYKAGQDVAAYLRAADMAAAVGMASPSASSETVLRNLQAGQLGKALSGEQITAIYKAGQTAGRAQLRKTGMTRLGTGTVTFEQSAKGAKLNAQQKASVQFIRDLAKVTGIDFTIYKSSADSTGRLQGANGAYRDGTVHVDLNAGAAYEGKLESASMLRTVSHELTHYMAEAAPTEFSALQDFMVQRLSQWEGHSIQDLAEGKMATAEQAGHPITAQEALEEVVADGCEMMLRDSKAVQQLAEENRTLFEKVRDWMKKFFESLRKAFEGVEAVHPESIHMMENYAGEMQRLWDEAFTAAVKNAKESGQKNSAHVGADVRLSVQDGRLTAESTEQERYELLKDVSIRLASVNEDAVKGVRLEDYNTRKKSAVIPGFRALAKQLGILNVDLQNSEIGFPFQFSGKNLEKSLHHQLEYGGTYQDYVRMMSCFNDLVENAVPIEVHTDKKAGTAKANQELKQVYVLTGAYRDAQNVAPVQFEVKEFEGRGNKLYLSVVLTKISSEVLETGVPGKTGNVPPLFSEPTISLRQIFENVNPADGRFLKYVPDGFLNEAQKNAKAQALRKQEQEYAGYGAKYSDRDYLSAVESGDMETAQKMVEEAAKAAGYVTHAYHGTLTKGITEFKKSFIGSRFSYDEVGFFFTDNLKLAQDYATSEFDADRKGEVISAYIRTKNAFTFDAAYALKNGYGKVFRDNDAVDVWDNYQSALLEEAEEHHADSIIIKDGNSMMVVAFEPNQIKSAEPVVYDNSGNVIPLSERFNPRKRDIRYSERDYSYEALTEKPDMEVTEVSGTTLKSRADIIFQAKQNAARIGTFDPKTGSVSVYVKDIGTDVVLATNGLKHSLDRRFGVNAPVVLKAGEILQNSIRINEMTPKKEGATASYVLIGAARNSAGELSLVRSVVNRFSNEVTSMDVLYAMSAKKEPAALLPRLAENSAIRTDSTISIRELLDYVNEYFPDVLPQNVLEHYGRAQRPETELGRGMKYQERDTVSQEIATLQRDLRQMRAELKRLKGSEGQVDLAAAAQYDAREALRAAKADAQEAREQGILAGQMAQGRQDAKAMSRLEAKLAQERAAGAEGREALRAANRDIRAKDKTIARNDAAIQRLQDRIARTEERLNERIAEQRQRLKDYRENRNETEAARRQRAQIEARCEELTRMLTQNNDKQHIPESLKQPVKELLEALTPSRFSQSMQERGTETQADARLVRSLEKIRRVAADQAQGKLSDLGYLDLPPEFLDDIDDIFRFVSDGQTEPLYAMNSAQLKELNQVLTVLTTSIKQINRLITAGHFESVRDAAEATALDLDSMRERKLHFGLDSKAGKAEDVLRNFLSWKNTTPYYAFRRFGEGGQDMFRRLADGWDRLAFNSDRIIRFAEDTYTEKEVKAWEKEKHTVTLDSGEVITLSTANAMELYELSKREQAQGHLYGGGVRISGQGIRPVLLTVADVENIAGLLSERQKAVADRLQQYMEIQGSAWGNEVSMERFGYRYFTEPHYYPVVSDSNELIARDTEAQENSMFRLLNLSATKGLREGANNAIVIGSIFDTFANHMSDMAKYNALALPILDTMKWFNYRDTVKNGAGQLLTQNVKQSIEAVYGSDALRYFTTFIKDLNGVSEGGRGEGFANRMISNYKVAAVAANLRVALLQPTAYVRAANVISPKYLTLALKNAPKALWNASGNVFRGSRNGLTGEMLEHSGIALWKSLGFYDTNIGRGVREQIKNAAGIKEKVVEKSMSLAELGDTSTWTVIWSACKLEQKAKGYTGQALLQQTAERFREVVYATQVVDSTMTRSHMMRSKSTFSKLSTAFMSEPTLSYNMLLDAAMGIQEANRRGGNGWKAQGGKLLRAFTVFASTAAASALVESLFDAFRDDDDEDAITKFINALFGEKLLDGNLGQNLLPIGSLPYLKDAVSILQGYSNERMDTEFISKIVNTAKIWAETYKLETGELDKATKVTSYGSMTTWGKVYKTLDALSSTAGLPLAATTREVTSIWNATIGAISPRMKIKRYESKDQKLEWLYSFAQSGSTADYEKELAGLRRTFPGKKTEEEITESIQDGLRGKIKDHYLDGDLTEQEAQRLIERYTGRDAEEAEDDVNRWHYQRDTGDTDASASMAAAWYGIAEPAGIDREAFAEAWAFHNDVEADKDSSGKTVPGSKKQKVVDYIQGLGLSRDQEKALWDALKGNWKDTDTPWE